MSRKTYLICFLAFAAAFVPVVLSVPFAASTVPAAYFVFSSVWLLFKGELLGALVGLVVAAFYGFLFYTAARFTYWLSQRPDSRGGRWTFQIIVLLALLSCSFLRVLNVSSMAGRGGTYTFWSAIPRAIELIRQR